MTSGQRIGTARHAPVAGAPGEQLRAAREAAGMSLDQVAQQLKLAPRQVKALEEQDFAHLPGRTFTRGFVRNYARLLHLDAGGLLARLPDAAEAPALEPPALQMTGAMIAELPAAEARGRGFARWLIPLVLVGCVVAAAGYEWYRGGMAMPNEPLRAAGGAADQSGAAPPSTGIPLRNPLDAGAKTEQSVTAASPPNETATAAITSAPAPVENPAAPAADAPAPTSPAAPATSSTAPPAAAEATIAPVTSAPPPAQTAPAPAASSPQAAQTAPAEAKRAAADVGAASLLLTYRGASWTRIRDRNGNVLISRTVPSGSQQSLRGAPPFEIVIGNANMVTLVYRGAQVDLARFTSHNVARLRLS